MWQLYTVFKENVGGKQKCSRPSLLEQWPVLTWCFKKFWEFVVKHFNTSFWAEVLEAGLELHSPVELDKNHKKML